VKETMPSSQTHREALRALLRRVDEVRGLSSLPPLVTAGHVDDTELLLAAAGELVDELERSHRRLIETNVQLVSLREVANSMVSSLEGEETTRAVTHYLLRAFAFGEVFLCLANREQRVLEGTWSRRGANGISTHSIRLPLVSEDGVVNRVVWGNRTVTIRDPRRNPPFHLDDGHALAEILPGLSTYTVVPLQRGRRPDTPDATTDACPASCPLQGRGPSDAIPDPDARPGWAEARDAKRQRCLDCSRFPVLGVVGVGRSGPGPGLNPAEVTLLESVALSVAPVLENARLYVDLRRSERFLDHVLNSMSSGLAVVGLDGRILIFNRAAEELTGHQAGYAVGEPLTLVFAEDSEEKILSTLRSGREWFRHDTVVRRPDGAQVPVSLNTSLLRDERRNVYGAIATFNDLSRLKRMEEEIRQLDRLAALGRFTSSVAHEIRNPLTGIAAGVEYLKKSFPEGSKEDVNVEFIQNEIARLDRIVGDLFTVTHPKRLSPRRSDLQEVVERSLQSVQAILHEKNLRVEWVLPEKVPVVMIDPDQMQQVFINLIKNAAEASLAGGRIRLRFWLGSAEPDGERAAEGTPSLCLAIEDEGPGIPTEYRQSLFEPFFTTKPGGTGLGLYVSHDIVKRHGGALRARSESGRGASFVVELPLEPLSGGRHA
jgi:PAS domain S-box-containing protein